MIVVVRSRMLRTHLGANSGSERSALVSGMAKSVTTSADRHRYALEMVAGRFSAANSARRSHSCCTRARIRDCSLCTLAVEKNGPIGSRRMRKVGTSTVEKLELLTPKAP